MRIFMARHGETDWNVEKNSGQYRYPLERERYSPGEFSRFLFGTTGCGKRRNFSPHFSPARWKEQKKRRDCRKSCFMFD